MLGLPEGWREWWLKKVSQHLLLVEGYTVVTKRGVGLRYTEKQDDEGTWTDLEQFVTYLLWFFFFKECK